MDLTSFGNADQKQDAGQYNWHPFVLSRYQRHLRTKVVMQPARSLSHSTHPQMQLKLRHLGSCVFQDYGH